VADLGGSMLAGPDPLIDMWTVHWLSGHVLTPGELFGGNIFHPARHAVLYSDLSAGTAVLLVPLRLFIEDPVPLHNAAVLIALAFSGWAFHALARELTGSSSAGLISGVMAAFGSHQMSHVYHLNLLSTGWIALLLLALHRLVRSPTSGCALLAGVSFALSAQSSGYYAVAATVLALVFAACHWRWLRAARAFKAATAAAALGVLLTLPYLHAFLELREEEGLRRPPGMSARMAFRPPRDLGSRSYLYGAVLDTGGERLFPGLLALSLGAVAVLRRRPATGFYAAATGALLLLSLGPALELGGHTLPLPYGWLLEVPPLDSMRHPYTFAAVATLTLAVLAGIGWRALAVAGPRSAAPLAVLLAVAETVGPAPATRAVPRGLPPVYTLLESLPPGPLLEVPVSAPDALLWAARHGRPVLNGDGAFMPSRSGLLERYIQNHWLKRLPVDVDETKPTWMLTEELPVRYVILPVGRRHGFRELAEAFDRSQSFAFVAEASDGDRIYEVREFAARVPR
jgi:hypothetical protein